MRTHRGGRKTLWPPYYVSSACGRTALGSALGGEGGGARTTQSEGVPLRRLRVHTRMRACAQQTRTVTRRKKAGHGRACRFDATPAVAARFPFDDALRRNVAEHLVHEVLVRQGGVAILASSKERWTGPPAARASERPPPHTQAHTPPPKKKPPTHTDHGGALPGRAPAACRIA